MANFHFFKNDGACRYMIKEIISNIPKYLYDPIDYNGKMIKFYAILKWVKTKTRGANKEWLDELGLNYVDTIEDLPEGAGIYISGYDADIEEVKKAKKMGIPIIENSCPWVKRLKEQLLSVNSKTHQCILLIDEDHMVYNCYKSIFPKDIIIVQAENYKEKLANLNISKPVVFLAYAAHRNKDAENIINYINENFPNSNNILDGYKKSICCWSNQGLIEEIEQTIKEKKLDEIWIVCSSEGDRSTKSIINEINENGAKPVIIKKLEDIPKTFDKDLKIGILLAPIPLSKKKRNLINIIRERHGEAIEIIRIAYEAFIPILLENDDDKINNKIDTFLTYCSDNIIWKMNGRIGIMPIAGTYKGKDGVKNFLNIYKKEICQQDISINKYISDGNYVDAHVFEESIAIKTSKKFEIDVIHAWKIDKNKKITQFISYNDTFEVQKAFIED